MSDKEVMTLNGAAALIAALKELPMITEDVVMRKGITRAAARLRTLMRRAAPRRSGTLAKSIGIKRIGKRKGNPKYKVGLLTRQYYKTLDAGRKAYTKKDGTQVSAAPDFKGTGTEIKRTWDSAKNQVANIVVEEATKEFAREAGKLAARSGYRNGGTS
jgi:hypothetical protein